MTVLNAGSESFSVFTTLRNDQLKQRVKKTMWCAIKTFYAVFLL